MSESNNQYFTIKPGYMILSRAEYDDIVEQRIASRNDRADLEDHYAKELQKTQAIISTRDRELVMLRKDYEDLAAREKNLAYSLHEANETILKLKAEVHLLNEELCKTDEIREVSNAVSEI